jgi:hypothetical protein
MALFMKVRFGVVRTLNVLKWARHECLFEEGKFKVPRLLNVAP